MSLTNQKAFDRVWDWFVVHGNAASIHEDQYGDRFCRYRGPDGTRCALGVLIPDEVYTAEIEGRSAGFVLSNNPAVAAAVDGVELSLLKHLQRAHDEAAHMRSLPFGVAIVENLRCVANRFNLSIPESEAANA